MQLTWEEIQSRALTFTKRWKDAWDEKSEAQSFVSDFLSVFGVSDAADVGRFERRALRDNGRGFMDYFWPKQIAIEMKTKGKSLDAAYKQLQEYVLHLEAEEMPDLMMVSNFENIVLYRRTTNAKRAFKTRELHKYIKHFANIAGYETTRSLEDQIEVNVKAAEKMAKLHDALKRHGYVGHDLEVYLVRLLFCLFADDTGIFPRQIFLNYIQNSKEDGGDLSDRVAKLFEVLNMPDEVRAKRTLLSMELKQFRYIDGGLFKDLLPSAEFDAKMRGVLIDCCRFDWQKISPAIFGAMFQGVMDKAQRRELGAHYTSEENILKLINPLFMDALWEEFEQAKTDERLLDHFHNKIASLRFLDPACGCGNFLIVTYRELRLLELELMKIKFSWDIRIIPDVFLKVKVGQFYGIEIEDFPCQIAQVGMWLMDHQMNELVSEQFGKYYVRLPLSESATIEHGNALRMDWESVVPKDKLSYILGNPPYVGYSYQSAEQKKDIIQVCGLGKIDYVAAWYFKAADCMQGTYIQSAFVSTNSITQGEQVAAIWKPLYEKGVHINFGIQTFKWSNEAKGKAAVHCVIVGFSLRETTHDLNPYLIPGDVVLIESRKKSICDVPQMQKGSIPVDGGNLIIEEADYEEFVRKDPLSLKYIRPLLGAEEYLHGLKRYCLWLIDMRPGDLNKLPEIKKRVKAVRNFRGASKKEATRKYAEFPTRFMEIRQPDNDYILIPRVSSEARKYIPFGWVSKEIITTDANMILNNATLYHFGILTSNVHMAWTRTVCGRLKSDYRYSKDIVYNNFPWPEASAAQQATIEQTAQAILDARAMYPNSSLADLYDPLTMPPELLKAHEKNDRAVMKAYGFDAQTMTEEKCVAELMKKYQELTEKK